ncbi:MAG: tetratricopeptide repeat protein [Alphaproteobacteria bacterium]
MTKPTAAAPLSQPALQLRRQAIQALTAGQLNEGIALLEKALAIEPNSGELHNDLGTANWQRGNPERAEMHYRRAIQLQPANPYALNSYGAFCLEQWRLKEAGELLKRAFAAKQDHHETLNNIGLLQYRLRNFAEAEKFLLNAIRLAPQWPNPYVTLGNVLQACRSTKKSEAAYRQALKLNPRNAAAWNDVGYLFFTLHRDDEAAECFKRCISIDPTLQSVWGRYLGLLERTNQLEAAADVLKDAKRRFPHCPSVITQEVKILRRQGKADEGISLMEACRPGIDAQQKTYQPFISEFYFELGQLYDRKGEADKAFECFSLSNAIEARNAAIGETNPMSEGVKRLTREFTADMAKGPAPATLPDGMPQPVFLIGFPRSGTTLLDQILSSHPDITVAEEKGAINVMAEELRAPGRQARSRDAGLLGQPRLSLDLHLFHRGRCRRAAADVLQGTRR